LETYNQKLVILFPSAILARKIPKPLRAWIFSGVDTCLKAMILRYGYLIGDFKCPTCLDVPGGKEKSLCPP
jgi:hypothetical protein